ncbi:hypothetical protein Tco_1440846, partial [Tanacetum coccineum]
VWEIDDSKHKHGAVVSIGFMCALNYHNPYLILMKNFRNSKTICRRLSKGVEYLVEASAAEAEAIAKTLAAAKARVERRS